MNVVTISRHHHDPTGGETAYLVDSLLPGDDAFPGLAGMDWTRYDAVSDEEASFVWRTGAQRFLALAEAVSAGKLDAAEARRSFLVRRFLEAKQASLEAFDDVPEDEEALDGWLLDCAAAAPEEVLETEGRLAFYSSESDEYLHDAARTLPLPPWARYQVGEAGGMASGYDEPLIVLARGKDLQDLGRWLQAEASSPSPLWASRAFDVPFLPFVSGSSQRLRVEPGGRGAPSAGRAPAILRVQEDYVEIVDRGWLPAERCLAGPLKGPAGVVLALLAEEARVGSVRLEVISR